ncbi:MAG: hypothetical protein LWX83_05965 [Anaerolineae bacterium]|nr:hypothetical protein [Anaerolineae bacterium]
MQKQFSQRIFLSPFKLVEIFSRPFPVFIFFSLFYLFIGRLHGDVLQPSKVAYFNYLADAFLHGQLNFRSIPPDTHDLILFQGRYFAYWPPFPALLLLPFVSLFGINFSDILFTLVLAALNLSLLIMLLRRARREQLVQVSDRQIGLLTLFMGLGTAYLTISPFGRVWFTSQIVSIFAMLLAYIAAISLKGWPAFLITGLGIAAAMATRNPLLAAGLFPAWYLISRHTRLGFKSLVFHCILALLPVLFTLVLIGLYNYLRFGSALDIGYAYHLMDARFVDDYHRYGPFSLFYVPVNVFYQYLYYPFPLSESSLMGGSLFLLSPLFFVIFAVLWFERKSWDMWMLLLTVLVLDVPILLLMGTGWIQFGPRYTLDFIVPLLLLTAMGLKRIPGWLSLLLVSVSIFQYLIGCVFLMFFI